VPSAWLVAFTLRDPTVARRLRTRLAWGAALTATLNAAVRHVDANDPFDMTAAFLSLPLIVCALYTGITTLRAGWFLWRWRGVAATALANMAAAALGHASAYTPAPVALIVSVGWIWFVWTNLEPLNPLETAPRRRPPEV